MRPAGRAISQSCVREYRLLHQTDGFSESPQFPPKTIAYRQRRHVSSDDLEDLGPSFLRRAPVNIPDPGPLRVFHLVNLPERLDAGRLFPLLPS